MYGLVERGKAIVPLAIQEATLDDLLREATVSVLQEGSLIIPTKGQALDLTGVRLELTNPLARLSRSETRGRLFSCLGELCWYLAGTNQTEWIAYYLSQYREYDEDGYVFGGYGPRLRGPGGGNQIEYVIEKLRRSPASRKAVIQIFDSDDIAEEHLDVPCTCVLQFVVRGGRLHLVTYMRSNDLYLGLPHDVFAFTMIQELIARSLKVRLGTYVHMVGSLHLYTKDREKADTFLNEGWQSTIPMPVMPSGDQWQNVEQLLDIEAYLRQGGEPLDTSYGADQYWTDLARVLAIYALWRADRSSDISGLRSGLSSEVYKIFVSDKLAVKG